MEGLKSMGPIWPPKAKLKLSFEEHVNLNNEAIIYVPLI